MSLLYAHGACVRVLALLSGRSTGVVDRLNLLHYLSRGACYCARAFARTRLHYQIQYQALVLRVICAFTRYSRASCPEHGG
jgi:hypothetical protein